MRFRHTRYFRADPTPVIQAIGEHNMGILAEGFPGSRPMLDRFQPGAV